MSTQEELQAMWEQEAAAAAANEAPAEETPPPEPEAAPEPAKQPEPEPEPQPDPIQQALEELRATNAQLQERLRRTEGHIGGLTSELKRTKEALSAGQAAAQQATEAPTSAQMQTASKNPEAWERLKEDFPEWADGVEAFMSSRLTGLQPGGQSPEQVQQLLQQQEAALRADMQRQMAELQVETRHEGWKETVRTPEFSTWVMQQAPEIQALATSDSPRDAIRMLDLFSAAKAKPAAAVTQDRKSRLAASATPRGDNVPVRKSLDDMSPQELWDFEAKRRVAS